MADMNASEFSDYDNVTGVGNPW